MESGLEHAIREISKTVDTNSKDTSSNAELMLDAMYNIRAEISPMLSKSNIKDLGTWSIYIPRLQQSLEE